MDKWLVAVTAIMIASWLYWQYWLYQRQRQRAPLLSDGGNGELLCCIDHPIVRELIHDFAPPPPQHVLPPLCVPSVMPAATAISPVASAAPSLAHVCRFVSPQRLRAAGVGAASDQPLPPRDGKRHAKRIMNLYTAAVASVNVTAAVASGDDAEASDSIAFRYADIGCGDGIKTAAVVYALASELKVSVNRIAAIGVDINTSTTTMIAPAATAAAAAGTAATASVTAASAPDYPFRRVHYSGTAASLPAELTRADLLTVIQVMHHIPYSQQLEMARELYRRVRSGGVFILKEHDIPSRAHEHANAALASVSNVKQSVNSDLSTIRRALRFVHEFYGEHNPVLDTRSRAEWRVVFESVGFKWIADTPILDELLSVCVVFTKPKTE